MLYSNQTFLHSFNSHLKRNLSKHNLLGTSFCVQNRQVFGLCKLNLQRFPTMVLCLKFGLYKISIQFRHVIVHVRDNSVTVSKCAQMQKEFVLVNSIITIFKWWMKWGFFSISHCTYMQYNTFPVTISIHTLYIFLTITLCELQV